jgi:arginine transport system substrate-binding protein
MKILAIFLYLICSCVSYSNTLIIGTSKYNPPFETWGSGDNQLYAYGFDIDLMRKICRRMSAECKFKSYGFDDIFTALQFKEVDLVISAIIVTAHRRENFIFSIPYLESNAQYITNLNSTIQNLLDIHGKKVGARAGTPYGPLAEIVTKDNSIIMYNTIDDMFVGLQKQEVDVCLMDYESVKNWIAINPGVYKLIGGKIPIGEGYAIMLNPDQNKLKNDINRILFKMEADGTYLRIYKQYFN